MLNVNNCTMVGRVMFEPDRTTTSTGKNKAVFKMEIVESFPNGGSFKQQIAVELWTTLVTKIEGMKKDDTVCVVGRLQGRTWEDKQGMKHETFDIVAREVSYEPSGGVAAPKVTAKAATYEDKPDSDVPF